MYKSSLLQVVKKKFTIYYISFEFRKKAKDEQGKMFVVLNMKVTRRPK